MYIVIDTNIFFNNWFLLSPHFAFLANFANNTDSTLLVSRVVCQEVDNKYRQALHELANNFSNLNTNYRDMGFDTSSWSAPVNAKGYDFATLLHEKFRSVEIVSYSNVVQEELVEKAIFSLRPFRGKEKGYRDALLWLSLLSFLKGKNDRRVVAFITNNSSDFFDVKDGSTVLHADLENDLQRYAVENKLVPYISLKAFVESVIDTKVHSFDHEEFEDKHGDELEGAAASAAVEYLNALSVYDCRMLMEDAGYPAGCMDLLASFRFDDYEGVEDPDIISISKIENDRIFIQYQFNLLSVVFEGVVPTDGYFANIDLFDRYFVNIISEGRQTEMESYPRIYFDASIIFNRLEGQVDSVSIDVATIRRRF